MALNKSTNLNTQNVGPKIVSPLSAGLILKPKSALRVPALRPPSEDPFITGLPFVSLEIQSASLF